ncbi:hypothetical protein EG68_11375 [Paragonimus skrjabini miyazakii]|uniref:SOCS box domain-containing protein n=1 Tax=Paragonimus skrjabini miyazakii TaxID=59628 RepID=A0A8S9YLX4_9TREM|nr:hypothetical protein EG68_11375 [Paragonimus skrjabini miyazakii]
MATTSLLHVFDQLLTPIQLAEAAIKEDNAEKLQDILNRHSSTAVTDDAHHTNAITETTFINQQAQETLLHFAVHQEAGQCVALLCNKPYCWSADRPNLIGRTPLHLAESRGYLPVWYPLAMNSTSNSPAVPLPGFSDEPSRSVAALLIYPHLFFAKPLSWDSEVLGTHHQFGSSVSLYTKELSAANLSLLFELYLSTPEVIRPCPAHPLHFWPRPPPSEEEEAHLNDCLKSDTSFPVCLCELPPEAEPSHRLQRLFHQWASHRLQGRGESDRIDQASQSKETAVYFRGPFSLIDSCRVCVRRMIFLKLVELYNSKTESNKGLNYPKAVSKLPLPPTIQAFLAYREFWPAWKRHMVPPRRHRARGAPIIRDFWFPIPTPRILF